MKRFYCMMKRYLIENMKKNETISIKVFAL